jgi:hypothetical protein
MHIIARMSQLELPEGCPPSHAVPCTGVVFRLVSANPLKDDDFKSHYEADPTVDYGDKSCEARGLSVRIELRAALKFLANWRKRYKTAEWLLARAEFIDANGKVGKTFEHPDHYTWWPDSLDDCKRHFGLVEESQ